jgi:hypothetical protein
VDPDEKPLPEDRKQKQRKRKKKSGHPDFNMRAEAYKLYGVDLTQIPGLMTLVFMLFSEVGRDMSRWPTAAHCSLPGYLAISCAVAFTSGSTRAANSQRPGKKTADAIQREVTREVDQLMGVGPQTAPQR